MMELRCVILAAFRNNADFLSSPTPMSMAPASASLRTPIAAQLISRFGLARSTIEVTLRYAALSESMTGSDYRNRSISMTNTLDVALNTIPTHGKLRRHKLSLKEISESAFYPLASSNLLLAFNWALPTSNHIFTYTISRGQAHILMLTTSPRCVDTSGTRIELIFDLEIHCSLISSFLVDDLLRPRHLDLH